MQSEVPTRKLNQSHFTILDDFVGEWLPHVNVFGSTTSSDDADFPLNARCVVLVYQGRLRLPESEAVQKRLEVQYLTASSRC